MRTEVSKLLTYLNEVDLWDELNQEIRPGGIRIGVQEAHDQWRFGSRCENEILDCIASV